MNRKRSSLVLLAAWFFIIHSASSTTDDIEKPVSPDGCYSSAEEDYFTLHCTSFNFIKKLTPKELINIESLDVSNASLKTLDKHLVKKLVNLERLNLSHNRLTDIKHFPFLPKLTHLNLRSNLLKSLPGKQLETLKVLDISHNYIREIPVDLPKRSVLKRLYLGGNVFTCSRESLDIRDALLDKKVKIIGSPICNTPTKFRGKSWLHAVDFDEYIKLHDQDDMLADAPEGSGEVSSEVNLWTTTFGPDHEHKGDTDFDFGSGELDVNEHIGYTEEPVTELEINYSKEVLDSVEEGSGDDDGEADIFSTTEVQEPIITTKKSIHLEAVYTSTVEPIDKMIEIVTPAGPDGNINEELGNVEANKSDEGSIGTNIFLVFIVLALVALLVYFIKKRKANKKRQTRQKTDDLEKQNADIELLPKTSVVNEKQNGKPETTPLMNGQNGEVEKDIEKDSSDAINQSPAELRKHDAMNGGSRDSVDSPMANSPSRSPTQDVLSVKVKASEIPDSIPKTPILVDRRKASDGQNIVITPNQRNSAGD